MKFNSDFNSLQLNILALNKVQNMKIEQFLKSSPTFAAIFAAQFISKQISLKLKDYELTYLQALVLVAIFFEPSQEARPLTLAKSLRMTKGNVSHSISHLQAVGLIQYDSLRNDKRGSVVRLNVRGKTLVTKLIKYFDEMQRKTEDAFSVSGTKKMMAGLEQLEELYRAPMDK